MTLSNMPQNNDHQALANTLEKASSEDVNEKDLPIGNVKLSINPLSIEFTAFDKRWVFDGDKKTCNEIQAHP